MCYCGAIVPKSSKTVTGTLQETSLVAVSNSAPMAKRRGSSRAEADLFGTSSPESQAARIVERTRPDCREVLATKGTAMDLWMRRADVAEKLAKAVYWLLMGAASVILAIHGFPAIKL